jgi:outer membrane protein, heavy metal efflux system
VTLASHARFIIGSARSGLFALVLIAGAGVAQAQPLTFEAAIRQAMSTSPEVAAREIHIQATQSAAIPAGALPDPKLFLGVENYPVTGPNAGSLRDEMTMLTAGVMQELPNSGKRQARVARAQADIGVARAEVDAHHREVAVGAGLAWLDAFYAERRTAALDRLTAENRLLADTVAPRIASGSATAAEAVAFPLQDAALADRRTALAADAARARAELRRWIGPAADGPLAESTPSFGTDPAALRSEVENHPALRVYESSLARADAETREAEAAKRPDLALQAGIHRRDPQFGWMVSAQVTIDLPLFASTRQDPLIAAKAAEANRLRIERDAVHRRLLAEFESAVATYRAAAEASERIRGTILPLLGRKIELETASYQAGTARLDAVLAARREQVETELSAVEREAEMARAAARVRLNFGSTLP